MQPHFRELSTLKQSLKLPQQGIALGRKVVAERVSDRVEIMVDNVLRAVAVPLVDSHDTMINAGYARLLDRYPSAQGHPYAAVPLDLSELYVLAEPRKVPHAMG
jgi:hypothetical protein